MINHKDLQRIATNHNRTIRPEHLKIVKKSRDLLLLSVEATPWSEYFQTTNTTVSHIRFKRLSRDIPTKLI
jgi:hypothetical protein